MRKASLLRYGSVVLALSAASALAHCGGDDALPVEEVDSGMGEDAGATVDTGMVATETGADSGTLEEVSGETSAEAGGDADDAGDAVATDGADAGCGALAATATDVYVDKASTRESVGTAACPFKTIKEATDLAAVAGRTIHVKGGTSAAPAIYAEGGLVVKDGVKLVGDGATSTKISGAGSCADATCAVQVSAGATLDGFAIASSGNGVVTADGSAKATVRNVLVSESTDGIVVLGDAELGINVQANKNRGNGLHVKGSKTATVKFSAGASNDFNENDGNGVLVAGTARLVLEGANAMQNKGSGVVLNGTTDLTEADRHSVTGLTAKNNGKSAAGTVVSAGSSGLVVNSTSSLILRNSVIVGNAHHGTVISYGTNAIDLGQTGSAGGNTFSTTATVTRNLHAALCLEDTGATGSQPAEGNKWAACALLGSAVTQTAITATCTAYTSQAEIAYRKKGSGGDNPVSVTPLTGCSTAP